MRGVPDVAGDASSEGGRASVLASGGKRRIIQALADQYAHHDLGMVNSAIYRMARSSSRLPGRSRVGPGDGLGNPRRASARSHAGPLNH